MKNDCQWMHRLRILLLDEEIPLVDSIAVDGYFGEGEKIDVGG